MAKDRDIAEKMISSHLGNPEREAGGESDYRCPFCGPAGYTGPSHLHVNYRKGTALCHQCGYRTRSLTQLVREVTGENIAHRAAFSANFYERVYDSLFGNEEERKKVDVAQPVRLPEGFRPLVEKTRDRLGRVVWAYLTEERHIPSGILRELGAGYCASGLMRGYAIFPVCINGELVMWTSRRVTGTGSKVRHTSGGKSMQALFMYDVAKRTCPTRLWLTEGPFDAISLHRRFQERESAVALFGTNLSQAQISLIGEIAAAEVIVCLDPDAADKAPSLAGALCRSLPCRVSIASPQKDPDELDDPTLAAVLSARVECDPFGQSLVLL